MFASPAAAGGCPRAARGRRASCRALRQQSCRRPLATWLLAGLVLHWASLGVSFLVFAPASASGGRRRAGGLRAALQEAERLKASELEIGREIEGRVTEMNKFGVFLDIGADKRGWLHVSKVRKELLEDPAEVFSIGDEVKAQILKVWGNEVEVSMRDDLPVFAKRPLSDFEPGDVVEGKVVDCTGKALFVEIGAMVDAYLPITQVHDGGAKPENFRGMFPNGRQIEAKVLTSGPNRLKLTLRTDMNV